MEFSKIGKTGIEISRIGLGTWAIGGWMWGGTDERESINTIRSAFDHGINLIDTAPVYGFGRSEEIVGKALAEGSLRNRTVLATKVGLDWRGSQPLRDASPRRIFKEIEASLKRLRTDVIDIYQVHWPDPARRSRKRRPRWPRFTSRERFGQSASVTFRRSRWTGSAGSRPFTPCSRPTICSSGASRATCCRTAGRRASQLSCMARSAAAC